MAKIKNKNNYIDNVHFAKILQEHKKAVKAAERKKLVPPRMPNEIGQCFLDIARKFGSRPEYNGYSYLQDMIADGYETCVRYALNYDPTITKNPLAYFTQIITYAFWRRIDTEHKQQAIKYKIFDASRTDTLEDSMSDLPDDVQSELRESIKTYDNIHDFLRKYDERQERKKNRAKKPKKA